MPFLVAAFDPCGGKLLEQHLRPPSRETRHSNPLLIPLVVVGGLMGIFAGYGVLAMIRDHGFHLERPAESTQTKTTAQTSVGLPESNSNQPPIDESPSPRSRDFAESSRTETNSSAEFAHNANVRENATATERSRKRTTPATEASLKIAVNNLPVQPPSPPGDVAAPPLPPPEQPAQAASQENPRNDSSVASAIVPLTLTQGTIRVIAIPDNVPPDSLLCDVGFSSELAGRKDLPSGTYAMVAERLDWHGEYLQELPLHLAGAGAAIEIKIHQQNKAAICEIHPKFSLPMSGIQQFTIARGSALQNSLSRSLNDAMAARQALPNMRFNLGQLQSELTKAQQATTQLGSNPADTGLLHHNATMAITRLNRSIAALNKDIAHSERLVTDEPAFRTDLDDLNQISQYAQSIASVATIYVRFHNGDVTIPA
ncbi:MAG TPA: hypothetical protein VH107_21510, partial [Lacipirellulaceae bacterium]|nr:hypothetical protein [Lacipirellulaceae bacterium]